MNVERHQAVVIGGGPAGLAAAIQLKQKGIDDVVVLERDASTAPFTCFQKKRPPNLGIMFCGASFFMLCQLNPGNNTGI